MPEIKRPWDYLILTASNPKQASAYRNQLKIRENLGFLSGINKVVVVPDPHGKRVGSAGSTILSLMKVLTLERTDSAAEAGPKPLKLWEDTLARLRILIIHAGGDSRRLPAYGPCGKAFIPLPGESESVLGSTIFDRQLPVYLSLPEMPPGRGQVVVTTGDVLLDFNVSEVRFVERGITGMGCLASPDVTQNHGVFIPEKDGAVRLFLQKPSIDEQKKKGAIDREGMALLDIGILNFDARSILKLVDLAGVRWDLKDGLGWSGPVAAVIEERGLDLYREVCCAMGTGSVLSQYIARMVKSGSQINRSCLSSIFKIMANTPFSVRVLSHCDFLHFGTIHQVMESGIRLRRKDRGPASEESVLSVNNRISEGGLINGHNAWIEGCTVKSTIDLGGENALVGVDIDESIVLPKKACIDVIKGRSMEGDALWFVRVYGILDNIKDSIASGTTFCNLRVHDWMKEMEADEDDLWDKELASEERSIWNARIFPAVGDPRNYRDWIWMFDPLKASETEKQNWRSAKRYSFEKMSCLIDQEEFYSRRMICRAGSYLEGIRELFQSESVFSARELSYLFGQMGEDFCVEWCVSLLKIAHEFQMSESQDSGLVRLEFSRILHTLATAIRISGETHDVTWEKILYQVNSRLSESEKSWLQSHGIALDSDAGPDKWLERMVDMAFFNLGQTIVMSGTSNAKHPQNTLRKDEIIWGRASARLDLGGGWTDTPPYALEQGGRVINAAVDLNGQPPIHVYARRIEALEIRIVSIDHGERITVKDLESLLDFSQPTSEFALAKASLVLSGLTPERACWPDDVETLQDILRYFGGGIELTTLAAIPSGSGLGTSSIMGAVLLSVIHRAMGRELSYRELFHKVLQLEQELTTGGGWQDQIGGTVGGVKLIAAGPGLVPDPKIHPVVPDLLEPKLNRGQTLLYYTGMRRLAKNILRNVVGNYLDRDRSTMVTLKKLHVLPSLIKETLCGKDMKGFGESIDRAWRLNKEIDPDSSNPTIEEILKRFAPFMHGAKLLGAGGGGFLLVICKTPQDAKDVRRSLEENPPNSLARFFDYNISHTGLEVTVC